MKVSKKQLLILFTCSLVVNWLSAQALPDSITKKIDSLFVKWNNQNNPGCTIGIVRNDSLIYAKGYGMANLEYAVPNTPETIFHMASVSKQFTAFSIVLLARQGKLKLDDDIHLYLKWFPDLHEKITIRNLLNHTSGIRDQWQLLAIAGTRIDDVITQGQVVKILSKQQALNFKTGEEYSYSNSGFTMLAEIVKSVTGQSLRKFTDSAVFKPLGMNNTHFHDDYTEIEKNRSYSYDRIDSSHFANSILSYSNAGATSLFTNINDMAKWVMNFYDHKVGDEKDIEQLTQKGKLNNGKEINYALGISVDDFKGWKTYSHNGADAGYRTSVTVLPDLKMGFIVFSNDGDFDPGGMGMEVANFFISNKDSNAAAAGSKSIDSSKATVTDSLRLKKFCGDYISDNGVQFSFLLKDKKFYWKTYNRNRLLIKTEKDTFSLAENPEVKFVFSAASKDTIVSEYWPGNKRVLAKYITDTTQTDKQLKAFTGRYYCPELDCSYGIVLKDHHLLLTNSKYNDAPLTLVGHNHLKSDNWWMQHMVILRDASKKITGFDVNSGRIMHLKFKKVE